MLITLSLQHVSAGEFTIFFSVAPLFGMVLGFVFLRERVTRWLLLGAMLVLGGIAVITLV